MAEKYITEEQRAKCRKVADAFAELYELTDVMVASGSFFTLSMDAMILPISFGLFM